MRIEHSKNILFLSLKNDFQFQLMFGLNYAHPLRNQILPNFERGKEQDQPDKNKYLMEMCVYNKRKV